MSITLAAVGLGASLLGTGLSTLSAVQGAKFQSKIAIINAKIKEDNAARAVERGQIEAQDQDRLAAAVIGDEISKQAGSGLNIKSGSFRGKVGSLQQLARLDAKRISHGARLEALNFLQEARGLRADASNFKRKAQFAIIAGGLTGVGQIAGSSLVSGALTSGSFTPGKFTGVRPGR